ncbi:MAG: carbohydrate ABC transporter permease, partial [Rhizobacter sp.]
MPSSPVAPPDIARTSARPRRSAWTPARFGIYAFLFTCAVFFLFPLYVMLITSVKPMEEIRLGNLFSLPVKVTLEP